MRLKIKEYREEFHWTQQHLAEKIGTSQRNISNWENGTSEPDCETIVMLAKIFDITIDELFGLDWQDAPRISYDLLTDSEGTILQSIEKLSFKQKEIILSLLKEMLGS